MYRFFANSARIALTAVASYFIAPKAIAATSSEVTPEQAEKKKHPYPDVKESVKETLQTFQGMDAGDSNERNCAGYFMGSKHANTDNAYAVCQCVSRFFKAAQETNPALKDTNANAFLTTTDGKQKGEEIIEEVCNQRGVNPETKEEIKQTVFPKY